MQRSSRTHDQHTGHLFSKVRYDTACTAIKMHEPPGGPLISKTPIKPDLTYGSLQKSVGAI